MLLVAIAGGMRRVFCLLDWVLLQASDGLRLWAGSSPRFSCRHCVGMCGVCVSAGAAWCVGQKGTLKGKVKSSQRATWPATTNASCLFLGGLLASNHPNHTQTTGCPPPPLRRGQRQ